MFKKLRWFLVIGVLSTVGIAYGFDSTPVSAATYSAGMSTSGSVTVNVSNLGNGTAVGTDNVTVTSTCPYGYNISISGPSNRNLYKDGNSSNNTAGTFISPSSGTSSSPATITGNNQGTWGYSLSSSTGTGTFIGLSSTQTTLTSKNSASASGGDSIPVYYGVSVASTHASGNYKMTGTSAITYYLTANENCYSYLVSFNANGGTGTMASQRIYEGVATALNTNTFTPPTGMLFDSWNTAANGSGTSYSDGQNVTDIASVGTAIPLYAQWKEDLTIQCAGGYICFGEGAPSGEVEGVMGRKSASDGDTVRLLAGNFSRTGYGFAGWSDVFDYATNANANFYGPSEDIIVPTGTTENGLSLYAVWVESEGNLQDSGKTTSVCNHLTAAIYNDEGDSDESTWSIIANLSSVSALTDTRDGNTYAIAKLTDGNCWMIENLRLADKDSNNNDVLLSSTNTNNPSLPLTNVYDTNSTSNHLSPTSKKTYNASTAPEGWCNTNSAACDDQSRLRTDNTVNRSTPTATQIMYDSGNIYSYGNYYNWYSATAGNGTYSKTSGETAGDICPTGWHLPTGTGSGEFGLLSVSLGGYKNANNEAQTMNTGTTPTGEIIGKRFRSFPNNYVYSAYISGTSIQNRGYYFLYWASSANGNNIAKTLYFSSLNFQPGTSNGSKFSGHTVRCLLSPSN